MWILYIMWCFIMEAGRLILFSSKEYNIAGKIMLFPVTIFWFVIDTIEDILSKKEGEEDVNKRKYRTIKN